MSNLTRIKNNQITDATIFANTKIAPGSIVGSLFASNITVTSDFLITGNLTVLGNSTVTTVASTNTFVNDPLIVLNNAFAGTNTYDLGLIFNRGSLTNQAFVYNEFNKEFRLLATSETGSTYGNINQTSFANINLGNITIQYDATVRNISTGTSNVNLLNTTATGIQFAGAATALQMGAATGNTVIRNNLDVGLTVQARDINATVIGNAIPAAATFSTVYNNNLTSGRVTFAGASSVLTDDGDFTYDTAENILTIKNTQIDGTNNIIRTTNSNANLVLSPNGSGHVDVATSRLVNVSDPEQLQDAATKNYVDSQVGSGVTNLVLDDTDISLVDDGIIAGIITGNIDGTQWLNVVTNSVSFYGVDATSTFTINNATSNVAVLADTFYAEGNASIHSNYNSTTWNNGALTVAGGVGIGGDVHIQGDLYVANIHNINEDILVVKEPLLYLEAANTYPYNYDIGFFSQFTGDAGNIYQHTGLVRDDSDSKWKLFGNVAAEPELGQVDFTGAKWETLVLGNIEVKTSGGLITDQTSINVFDTNATTLNLGGAATTITAGATSGTFSLRNANINLPNATTIFTGQTSLTFANTVTTTLNIGGDATAVNLGATTGTTTIRNAANIQATTDSTTAYNGALKVSGGVGVQGNLNIKDDQYLTLGIDILSGTVFSSAGVSAPVQIISNSTANTRVIVHNTLASNTVSTGYSAVADSGNTTQYYVDLGINSSELNFGLIKPRDGFLYVYGGPDSPGNLNIGAGGNIRFYSGAATDAGAQIAQTYQPTNSFLVTSTTQATSTATGALQVTGGVGIGGNIWIANGAIINDSQTSDNFIVKGKLASSLIVANSNYGAVVIGGSNASPQLGATLKINSTDSLLVPVGPTSDRPSNTGNVDIAGMLRFNSTTSVLEYYDGSEWEVAGTTFTVISDRQFTGNSAYGNVDGVNTTFTLQANSTSAGTLVSINGVTQFPVLAYSVTGDQLEFTEAPSLGDVIDARIFTTTSTTDAVASGNGYNQLIANGDGVQIWTGSSSTIQRVLFNTVGDIELLTGAKTYYNQTAVNIPSASTPVVVDSFSVSSFSSAKYVIQAKNGSNKLESMEALVVAEGANASVVTYGVVNSHGASMGTLTANVVSGNCRLYYTSTSLTNSNVKVQTNYIV